MRFNTTEVAVAGDSAIRVRWTDETAGGDPHLGWQLYDPLTGVFIQEGEWMDATGAGELSVTLPALQGDYRIYVSPLDPERGWRYQRGGKFLVVDARVAESGGVTVARTRVTTLGRLRREGFPGALRRFAIEPWRAIFGNWSLIQSMVRRDIVARYRGSFGGALWSVLHPLLLMSTYFFVFGIVLESKFPGDPSREGFVLYLLAGMLPWLAFSEAAGRAPSVMLEHRNFVKKLVFPVETLPVNLAISGLASSGFALAVFILGLLIARHSIPAAVAWLPLLLIPQLLFTIGMAWGLAALGVFLRDLGQINGFLLTLWFFLTPICYAERTQAGVGAALLRKNPMYVLVRGYRAIFLEGAHPEWIPLAKLWVLALVVFFAGFALFHKLRRSFADVI